jgi:hypothetical protein
MNAINWNTAAALPLSDLPRPVTSYLSAHRAHDYDAELRLMNDTTVVVDAGNTYTGLEQIRSWLTKATTEYSYTTTLLSASKVDDIHFDVIQRLEGDFPGNVVDLHFRFTLAGGVIVELVIEV